MTYPRNAPRPFMPVRLVKMLAIPLRFARELAATENTPHTSLSVIDPSILGPEAEDRQTLPPEGTLVGDLMRTWTDTLAGKPDDWILPPEPLLGLDDLTRKGKHLSDALVHAVTDALVRFDESDRNLRWPRRMRILAFRASAISKVLTASGSSLDARPDWLETYTIARIEALYARDLRRIDGARQARREDLLLLQANHLARGVWQIFRRQIEQAREELRFRAQIGLHADRLLLRVHEASCIALDDLISGRDLAAAQYLASLGRARMVIDLDCRTYLKPPSEDRA